MADVLEVLIGVEGGDVRAEPARQLVTSARDAATAALAAIEYVREGRWPA